MNTVVEDDAAVWMDPGASRSGEKTRYEVGRKIGSGAMGVIHEVYDPRLDRTLAAKFLSEDSDSPKARRRLLREAKAMGKLTHPNVVSVHDVVEDGGRVFVLMDLVKGVTLTQWLNQATRDWREIVDVYVQAGRGLAAAHAAGMVHRDFKPANVLVDEDGTARVMDFGLVRAVQESMSGELEDESEPDLPARSRLPTADRLIDPDGGAMSSSEQASTDLDLLTKTGAILGTPAYMAPEQATGQPADERSDQFSFCVALFEALFDRRPFQGASTEELLASVEREQIVVPRRSDVPRRIQQALIRGLRRDPTRRWPSMSPLLAELARPRLSIPVRAVAVTGAVALLAGAGLHYSDSIRALVSPVAITLLPAQAELTAPMELIASNERDSYLRSTVANQGRARFEVEIPSAGRYYLHGLVWESDLGGDRGDADSMFVYIDGGEERLWHFGCQNQLWSGRVMVDNWAWQPVLHMANADSDCEIEAELSWELEAGAHEIVIRNREQASPELAARLARLVITNQADWRP